MAIESNTLVEHIALLGSRTRVIQGAGLCPVVLPVLSYVRFSDTRVLSEPSDMETPGRGEERDPTRNVEIFAP